MNVYSYSKIEQSVILPQVDIAQHIKINRSIIDTGCRIPEGMITGINKEHDIARRSHISQDVILVTKDMLNKEDNQQGC
ncbi:MAG: glucose-1-phosphate adenylyltransferase [Paraglaciecola sp.]